LVAGWNAYGLLWQDPLCAVFRLQKSAKNIYIGRPSVQGLKASCAALHAGINIKLVPTNKVQLGTCVSPAGAGLHAQTASVVAAVKPS
jgi:hypothetical protein